MDDLTLQVHFLYPHLHYQSGTVRDTSEFILYIDDSRHIPNEVWCFAKK